MKNPVFIVTGEQGSGKTTLMENLADALKEGGFNIGGILAEGTWWDNKRIRFELTDLQSGEEMIYLSRDPVPGWTQSGHFFMNPEGQNFGENALSPQRIKHAEIIFIDEIGPFELQGKGWAKAFDGILTELQTPLILSVRKKLVVKIIEQWQLNVIKIFYTGKTKASEPFVKISEFLNS